MSKRFFEANLDVLSTERYSQRTTYITDHAQRLLFQYAESKNQPLSDSMSLNEVNDLLKMFYASVHREDGEELTTGSLKSIRYGLQRYFKSKREFDIINDSGFTSANEIFACKLAHLKKCGKGVTSHYPIISDNDLIKIGEMKTDSPENLLYKTWFVIQLQYARRGVENIHSMKKSDLHFFKLQSAKEALRLADSLTKNHRGDDPSPASEAVIVETGGLECPITLIKTYLEKLSSNVYLWQKPKRKWTLEMGCWFENSKIGTNTIATMMKKLSQSLNFAQSYTNHSIRATAITILGRSFEDNDIRAVSGHKSLNALAIYKRTSESRIEKMSLHLQTAMNSASTKVDTCKNDQAFIGTMVEPLSRDNSNLPSNELATVGVDLDSSSSQHINCCISYGACSSDQTATNLEPTATTSVDDLLINEKSFTNTKLFLKLQYCWQCGYQFQ